ncbi:MAG: KOW domain-containing RNA-binding protein [Clostridia bacterium]|nr:KOW domain-containing RNA-binding protein [Clostridia bacterium]
MRVGQIVRSRAGRDAGKAYVVIGLENERFALVADGATRTVRRPKRKNVRHLEVLPAEDARLAASFEEGRGPTDAQIRAALAELVGSPDAEGGAEAHGS